MVLTSQIREAALKVHHRRPTGPRRQTLQEEAIEVEQEGGADDVFLT